MIELSGNENNFQKINCEQSPVFAISLLNLPSKLHYTQPRLPCIINSKINGTPNGVYLPISKLHSILPVTNLLAHNNRIVNYYIWASINSLRLKLSVASKWASKHLWGYHLFCCWWYHSLQVGCHGNSICLLDFLSEWKNIRPSEQHFNWNIWVWSG